MAFGFMKGDRASVVARTAAVIVLGCVVANLLFNAFASSAGAGYPYSSFLFRPLDRFGDFFKMAFSYPGAPLHPAASFWGIDDLLARHVADIRRFEGTTMNHFHMPPASTLLALAVRWPMHWIDPVLLFVGLVAAALAALFATVLRAAPSGRAGADIATVALLSYPAMLFVDRGHFFSLICAALLIAGTLRTLRDGRTDGWTILMFAIAVNIRPNAGVIPFALFLGGWGFSFRNAISLGLASVALFIAALAIVHQLYPPYSWQSFLSGLHDYEQASVGGNIGVENGSSLYGMLRAPFGLAPWMLAVPILTGGMLLAAAILESRQRRLRASEALFLVLCAYVFGTHVFTDYHLLVFIIPLILVAREEGPLDHSDWTVVLASCLMLAPKNFFFVIHGNDFWSWQVIANPLILLAASAIVLTDAWRRHTHVGTAAGDLPAAAA
jgi:hypothetical protein